MGHELLLFVALIVAVVIAADKHYKTWQKTLMIVSIAVACSFLL